MEGSTCSGVPWFLDRLLAFVYHPAIGQFVSTRQEEASWEYTAFQAPVDSGKGKSCSIYVCGTEINAGDFLKALFGHAFIKVVYENATTKAWGFRAGPGGEDFKAGKTKDGKDCDLTDTEYGQLAAESGEYNKDFVDYLPPDKENCRLLEKRKGDDCKAVITCFEKIQKLANECCIPYEPTGYQHRDNHEKGANSNNYARWLVLSCVKPEGGKLNPPDKKTYPGYQDADNIKQGDVPKCITDALKKEKGTGPKQEKGM